MKCCEGSKVSERGAGAGPNNRLQATADSVAAVLRGISEVGV